MESHIIYPNSLDNRMVRCGCRKPDCKIGLNFDSSPNVMLLTDKYGNEHAMHLTKENIKQIKDLLKK